MSRTHDVAQALPAELQVNGAHGLVAKTGHAPAPLQEAGSVATPAAQLAPLHAIAEVGNLHVARETPSHAPPHSEPSVAQLLRGGVGAPVTAVHVPREPVRLHASHWPVHAWSQQTLSTQFPEPH